MEQKRQGSAFKAANATVVGDVTLEENVNIWYGAVLRGDSGSISVGAGTNIQDNCVLHEKTTIGKNCTIGHGAIVHGCEIGDCCTIGMGSVILTGAKLGDHCLVGAGAVVTGKMVAPAGSLLLGSPAKVVKEVSQEQIADMVSAARHYVELAKESLPKYEGSAVRCQE